MQDVCVIDNPRKLLKSKRKLSGKAVGATPEMPQFRRHPNCSQREGNGSGFSRKKSFNQLNLQLAFENLYISPAQLRNR